MTGVHEDDFRTKQYNPADINKLADWIINGGTIEMDQGGGLGTHGAMYCTDCNTYEDANGNINHLHTCITQIAYNVLT